MFLSQFDGRDVTCEGNPDADSASPKKIDDNTYENTQRKLPFGTASDPSASVRKDPERPLTSR